MVNRKKSKAISLYFEPKYEEKLNYLRDTIGITKFFTDCLDQLEIDKERLEALRKLRNWKTTIITSDATEK